MKNTLKQERLKNKFTQQQAAEFLGVSLRSYKTYENDVDKINSPKYEYMADKLNKNALIDEEHGTLTVDEIKKIASEVFSNYSVDYCYLFGSYAKNKQKDKSDVDLLISTKTNGIKYYGLVEKLREKLNKKVDLLNVNQLENNGELIHEILKDGIKIYNKNK